MDIPTKKLRNGFEIPVFGIGTWMMGGDFDYDSNNNDEADIQAIKTAIEMGIIHIDTAEIYASGHSEEIVAEAIKDYDRSKLIIVSKVDSVNLKYDDVCKSIRASLKRLRTDYLDLYLLHAPNPQIPIKQTMKAMDFIMEQRLIKNIGVSNFSRERLEQAKLYSRNKIVVNQVHYNLIFREMERKGLLDFCQKNDIMLIAYRPLQKGLLAKTGIKIVDEMCQKYDKTSAQIAINWLISQLNVVTISKMSNTKHIKENLGAIGWKMDKSDIERLREGFPNQQGVSDVCPLI